MYYYLSERGISGEKSRTAWSKARLDAESICAAAGYRLLQIAPELGDRVNTDAAGKLRGHFAMRLLLAESFSALQPGDTLFIQLPMINNCLFLAGQLRRQRRKGVRIIALIHDLELLRMSIDNNIGLRSRLRMRVEEKSVLAQCDRIIVHNDRMLSYMTGLGVPRDKMLPLGIFDYLMDEAAARAVEKRRTTENRDKLIVAGNLSPEKAGYLYSLPSEVNIELYGVLYAEMGKPNLHYRGSFAPEELPGKLEGGFGLVWDGPSADTCEGAYGEYLRYNDPHKTSLYFASGLPVAIWENAALAELVRREGVGFTAGTVAEAAQKARSITDDEYRRMLENAAALGRRLREGEYLKRALERMREL